MSDKKKIFIIYAHPEPRSLNGSLKDDAVTFLTGQGHEVQVSDLYAMKWRAEADSRDFPQRDPAERLVYNAASRDAYLAGAQASEITAEQEKLKWADAIIMQFPLWWYSMPAILKGWVDRVYARRFAYGVGPKGYERFGQGNLKGKRAMLAITAGPEQEHYAPRGVHGFMDDLLFPITHGILYYPGMDVLPSFVLYKAAALPPDGFETAAAKYRARLETLFTTEPIPFRPQNGGDYDENLQLKPGLEGGKTGLSIHTR